MELSLKERFVLLSFNPKNGTNLAGNFMSYGLGGAMLLELANLKKIAIEDGRVRLLDSKKTGDEILDTLIKVLQDHEKPYKVKNLVSYINRKSKSFKKPVVASLVKQRYLKEEKKRFLIFKYLRHPVANNSYRNKMVEQIRRLVLRKTESEPDIPLLAGLAGACQFAPKFFKTKEERKIAKKRINEIIKESQIDAAIDETIKAIQAAVLIAVTTTATTAGAH